MMSLKTKKVAIYARVSTIEQAEEGYSIDAQLRILTEYCKFNNCEVFREYVDRGISGKSIEGRPALKELLNDAGKGLFDEVLVWKINRISRKQLDLLKIVELLNKNNISFRSYSEKFETETSMGKFAFQMMGAVGELERNTISDNVKMGMKERAREGLWNGGVVFGYDITEIPSENRKRRATRLMVNEEEAKTVRYIYELYYTGNGIKAITNRINKEGYKSKRGNAFAVATVKEILQNPIYKGYIRYNVRENWNEKRRKGTNPNPIIVKGQHEAIIEEELWEKVQQLYKAKSGRPNRVFDGEYPLTGILRCPKCGQGMVAGRVSKTRKDGTKYMIRYYYCGAWRNKGTAVCSSNGINADKVEKYVFDRLNSVLQSEKLLRAIVDKLNKQRASKVTPAKDELERIEKKYIDIDNKKNKYFKLYEDDIIDKETLSSRLQTLRAEALFLEKEKSKLSEIIMGNDSSPIPYEIVRNVLSGFDKMLTNIKAKEQKKTLLQLVIDEITTNEKRDVEAIKIKFNDNLIDYVMNQGELPHKGDSPFSYNKLLGIPSCRFTVSI